MAEYRLSRRAAADLGAIAEFTIQRFGLERARRYRDELKTCFEALAENPRLGRGAGQLAKGLSRYEHQSHIVLYQATDDDVLVVRVLHHRMDVPRHL